MGGKRGYRPHAQHAQTHESAAAPDANLNRAAIEFEIEIDNLPRPTRAQYGSAEFIARRCRETMEIAATYGIRPNPPVMAHALDISRTELQGLANGYGTATGSELGFTQESIAEVKRQYSILEDLATITLQESKRSPIAGIFLAKNHFGYTNETTVHHDATPRTAAALQSADAIAQRYAAILGAMPAPQPPALEAEVIQVEDAPEDDERRE